MDNERSAPFRYWGSKVGMAPWIIERLPMHEHFIEACAGSAAVMAQKPPVLAETVNDVYDEVVNFFRVLRDPVTSAELIDRVTFTPYARSEFQAAETVAVDAPPVDRAWAFFVRMQMAVVPGKSGWSYGVGGEATRSANKAGRWSTMPAVLTRTAERFRRVQVSNFDIVGLIERFDAPGVLIFVDPPYLFDVRPASFDRASAYVHDNFDHDAFLAAVAASKHASFAVTHYPHPMYDDWPWDSAEDFASYRNRPNGTTRDERTERLYLLDRSTAHRSSWQTSLAL